MCWTLSIKSSALQGRGGGKLLPPSLGKALNASSSWRTLRIQKEPIIFPRGPWNPVHCLQMISEKFRLTGEWSTNVMPVRNAHSCKVLTLIFAKQNTVKWEHFPTAGVSQSWSRMTTFKESTGVWPQRPFGSDSCLPLDAKYWQWAYFVCGCETLPN